MTRARPGDRAAPSPADTARLVAFLEGLTDEGFLRDPRHALPRTAPPATARSEPRPA
ncbi:hypothetical protein [Phenylobacterium sp. SCN 70-31]|uniref:hypothetical protein n=1 Tax=Phenylobacterium sp. SCN 70-31 TaxID=1660129 RepID=UPI0025D2DC45|nr:hypothetical protein [Phenylobacterium sp. SCN 70-31]